MKALKKKDKLYYARILPQSRTYEICDLIVRTVTENWFVAVDKMDKHAYLFCYNDIDKTLFSNRETALLKVLEAERSIIDDYESE